MTIPIIVATITTLLVLGVRGWMTTVGPWYQNLRKPSWNPPNWIFGPAWTVILGLAVWSGVLSWTHASGSLGQLLILVLFGINIVLHMLWSPLFFNLKRPDWALIEVPFLWLSIVSLMLGEGAPSRSHRAIPRHRMTFVPLPDIWRFTLCTSMNAGSRMRACSRKMAISTEAGLPLAPLVRSRAPPARVGW